MSFRRLLPGLILFASILVSTGCAAFWFVGGAAVGAGSIAYLKGELVSEEGVPFQRAWDATLKAIEDLGYTITSKESGESWGELITRGPDTTKTTIHVNGLNDKSTEIRIHVGYFGDEDLSMKLLTRIRANLRT